MKPRKQPDNINETTELCRLSALEEVVDRIVEKVTKSECAYCGRIGCEHQQQARQMFTPRQARRDSEFLHWLTARLVKVYGESPNVDFVLKLHEIADNLEKAGM